jgi:hypothetical protein
MYSGGHFDSDTYAIGCASATELLGPWSKYADNPIFQGRGRIRGPGHHSFVFGPDATTPYAVYHGYVDGERGRKVMLDRLVWSGDLPRIAGPTDVPQPVPPRAAFDARVPHRRAEAWVRGRWVEVEGARFELAEDAVWHQVEVVETDRRWAVRVGGVLRASRPALRALGMPDVRSDGDVTHLTVASALEDGGLHELPASSWYVWEWGGEGRLELELAIDGTVDLVIGDQHHVCEGDRGGFRFVQFAHDAPAAEIAVRAGPDGAVVTDLAVRARA